MYSKEMNRYDVYIKKVKQIYSKEMEYIKKEKK